MKQVIYGTVPSKSNCYIIVKIKGVSSLAKSPALRKYENDFYIQCNQYRGKMIEGYFEFHMDVFYPNQRADLDNSLKVVLDCLQRVKAFKNDNKAVGLHIRKFKTEGDPRIEFEIVAV
ncbi:RusA family crossover junction endodeoxyribonuclease [Chitinophaga sp. MM2321]|uniref:RusA family crossover junction endodeoxyribonuclease n=1 Tax=Chitinophaga sp. MM2321 TaxID=3137178 RepID=UPI0032D58530